MKNKNTVTTILIVAVILLIGYFLYSKKIIRSPNKLSDQSDLTKASKELNNTNIDSIDNELNENTSEASSL